MQQAFENLIAQLRNPQSDETQNAMRMLNTPNNTDIPYLIGARMNYQPPFNNSMGLFSNFDVTERNFAGTIPGLNPDLWVAFVAAIRQFVQTPQQPQQQPQQQQPQQQQQQPQGNRNQQQPQPQQQQQQRDVEPVLGPVPPMPFPNRISMRNAREHESAIAEQFYGNMGMGGKKARSKKRGLHRRKSIHRRKKSIHKKRK